MDPVKIADSLSSGVTWGMPIVRGNFLRTFQLGWKNGTSTSKPTGHEGCYILFTFSVILSKITFTLFNLVQSLFLAAGCCHVVEK